MTNRFGRKLLAIALLWLFVGAALAFELWPNLPRSNLQWFLFLAFGPPLYIMGETFFGWLLSERHGRAISPGGFSIKRVAVAVPVLLALSALGWWLLRLLTISAA